MTPATFVSPVAADCPGGSVGLHYANSYQSVTYSTGIEAWIGYTSPTLCSNGAANDQSVEWVNLSRNGSNDGRVQHGWMRSKLFSGVRWFCEFNPRSTYPDDNYMMVIGPSAITATAHKFRVKFNNSTNDWDCLMDDVTRAVDDYSNLGFASGTFLAAGGEAHGPAHIQIGTNAPTNLGLTVMKHYNGTYWLGMNVSFQTPAFPWGSDEPTAGEFRNWTNAH